MMPPTCPGRSRDRDPMADGGEIGWPGVEGGVRGELVGAEDTLTTDGGTGGGGNGGRAQGV